MPEPRPTPPPRIDLVVVSGPDEGLRFPLVLGDPPEPIPIGRSAKGLKLADPLVSIHHAEIQLEDGRWVLRDVGSATGTRFGGAPLRDGDARSLQHGDTIEIGETTLVVTRRSQRLLLGLGAAAVVVVAGAVAAVLATIAGSAAAVDRALTWHEPIQQGAASDARLALSPPFLRQRGIDPAKLSIRRVTDFDTDGVDEVWLRHEGSEYVVTFDGEGGWIERGELPEGCVDGDSAISGLAMGSFPPQRCPGRFMEMSDGRYRVAQGEGVVVWVLPPAPEPKPVSEGEAPPPAKPKVVPYRVSLRRPERLAGFLAERGVPDPVAWLLCEDALPGLAPQVGAAKGEARPLGYGCLKDLSLEGRIEGKVVAAAFTEGGREALLRELARFYGGNADGLFLTPAQRRQLTPWSADPGFLQGGARLDFDANEQFFEPVLPERPLPQGPEPLLAAQGTDPAPPALTATLLTTGTARLDPPGCSVLEVSTSDWSCRLSSGCVSGSGFLTVREVGCGAPRPVLSVPYRGGDARGTVEGVGVRGFVESSVDGDATVVRRARVSYRLEGGGSSP